MIREQGDGRIKISENGANGLGRKRLISRYFDLVPGGISPPAHPSAIPALLPSKMLPVPKIDYKRCESFSARFVNSLA